MQETKLHLPKELVIKAPGVSKKTGIPIGSSNNPQQITFQTLGGTYFSLFENEFRLPFGSYNPYTFSHFLFSCLSHLSFFFEP